MVFHWILSDSKSLPVSRTPLRILSILNNVVVWMVSIRPPSSKSSSSFNNPLGTVPKAPITIGVIVTFIFHNFFNSLARSMYLSFFFPFPSVLFCSQPGQQSSPFCNFSFLLLLIIIRSGILAEIRWSIYMSKSHRGLWVSFSRKYAGLCIYHL